MFVILTQSDVLISTQYLILFWRDSRWDVIFRKKGIIGSEAASTTEWILYVVIPTTMKLVQGLFVTIVSFVVIVQSDDTIDLIKVRDKKLIDKIQKLFRILT